MSGLMHCIYTAKQTEAGTVSCHSKALDDIQGQCLGVLVLAGTQGSRDSSHFPSFSFFGLKVIVC